MKHTETIYFGGPILTMEEGSAPQAVLVRGDRIAAVGDLDDLRTLAPGAAERDLEGRALLPAFVDSHSHITAVAATLGLCQLGAAASPAEAAELLAAFRREHDIPAGEWVIGFGYDHNVFPGEKHPTRQDLDRVLPDCPALITHASGHMGVMNTLGLEKLGLTAETPDPAGGRLGRDEHGQLTGYLEEAAFLQVSAALPTATPEQALEQLRKAQEVYLSRGITLVQDGVTGPGQDALLRTLARENGLLVDVVGYADLQKSPELAHKPGIGRYRVCGYKLFLDGSPQGKTAWMRQPYENAGDYRGYPVHTDREVDAWVEQALRENRQILVHCNGDAAAEQLLNACERAQEKVGRPIATIRPVMIHAQLVGKDQLRRAARLGVIPSFFAAHTWYWGDIHLKNFGPERGSGISPLGTAQRLGLPFTLHQDSPVIPPDMVESVWCAVCRVTRNGVQLDPAEAVTPLEALKAVTLHAAAQYGLEGERGSIAPGKRADFAILSADPTAVSHTDLRTLRVLETIRDGETVYTAPNP